MNLTLSDAQQMLGASVADWLAHEYTWPQRAASVADAQGCRPAVWQHFARMGWLGLPLPEDVGGFGGSAIDLGLLMHAFGAAQVVEPFHAGIVLAARLWAALAAEPWRSAVLRQVIDGTLRLALAHDEAQVHEPWAPRRTTAVRTDGGWRLDGTKLLVQGAPGAALLLVTAHDAAAGAARVFALPPDTPGLRLHACATAGDARAADITLDGVIAGDDQRLGDGDATPALQRVLAAGLVALGWEACGTLQALLVQTVDHTRQRRQFGQAIAAFQVVQHRLAEMAVCCDEARAACELAALRLDAAGDDAGAAVAMAALVKGKVGRAARLVAEGAVQLHGAMGVCEELPVAAGYRRLNAFGQLGGATRWHAQDSGQRLLATGAWRQSQTLLPPAGTGGNRRDPAPASDGMTLRLDAAQQAFRDEVRAFLREHLTAAMVRGQRLTSGVYPEPAVAVPWQRALQARGWLVPLWPAAEGGTGWGPVERFIFETECALAGAPLVHPMGVRLVGPVLLRFGTPEQKARFLPGILSSRDHWCQGFSEPGAGSDLAALQTRADPDGDDYIVNGTKLWTTQAHHANWMFALVRTRHDGKPQQGISFLLIDMASPGITVRPIATIGGDHDVNQVFFDNVRVPQRNRVHDEHRGWDCAKVLLEFERGAGIFSPRLRAQLARVGDALAVMRERGPGVPGHVPALFGEVAADLDAFEMLELRTLCQTPPGQPPGPVASVIKLRSSRLRQAIAELGVEALGLEALRWRDDPAATPYGDALIGVLAPEQANSRAFTIFGGASEVQLGLIAKTALGL